MPGTPKTDDRLSLGTFLELSGIDERSYLEYLGGRVIPKVSPSFIQRGGE